jgi:hypothetical protein
MFICDIMCFWAMEAIQISNIGLAYFNEFWNLLDFLTVILNTSCVIV